MDFKATDPVVLTLQLSKAMMERGCHSGFELRITLMPETEDAASADQKNKPVAEDPPAPQVAPAVPHITLAEAPPLQASVTRLLHKKPGHQMTSVDVATALGMSLAEYKGKMRATGRSRVQAQDVFYRRAWGIMPGGERTRLYILTPEGHAAVEQEENR